MNVSPPPGFYPDPAAPGHLMYWDGAAWAPASRRPAPGGSAAPPTTGSAPPITPKLAEAPPAAAVPPVGEAPAATPLGELGSRPLATPWGLDLAGWATVPDLAATGARLAARIVDLVIVLVISAAPSLPVLLAIMSRLTDQIRAAQASDVTTTVYLVNGQTAGLWALCLAIFLAVSGGYEVWQLTRWGQTVGKRLVNIRVTGRDSTRDPSVAQAARRWLGYYLLLLVPVANLLDGLWLLWDQPYRQCLHDKLAGTVVVREFT